MNDRREPADDQSANNRREPRLFPARRGVRAADPEPPLDEPAAAPSQLPLAGKGSDIRSDLANFKSQVRMYILLVWLLPPAFSIFLLQYQGIYSAADMTLVLQRFGFAYIAFWTLAAALFLPRWAGSIAQTVTKAGNPAAVDWDEVRSQLKMFQWGLFGLLVVYCTFGPLTADFVLGVARGRPFSISEHILSLLATVPGVILSALPILFRLFDIIGTFFSQRGGGFVLVSLGAKIVALGMLSPAMVGAALFVYYRDRTGFGSTEALGICGGLTAASSFATYIAWRSFRHSLAPFEAPLRSLGTSEISANGWAGRLVPKSLDEIGLLAHGWSQFFGQDRRRYEAARDREAQVRLIMDSLPASIAYVDSEERLRFANRVFCDWWCVNFDEVAGKALPECLPSERYTKDMPRITAALAGLETRDTIEYLYPDGKRRICETSYLPHKAEDGSVLGYFSLATDITEQKTAEDAAREARQRLEDAIECLPAGFTLYDKQERLVLRNSEQRRLTPWNDELAPSSLKFEDLLWNTVNKRQIRGLDNHDPAAVEAYIESRLEQFRKATGKPIEVERENGKTFLSVYHKTTEGGTVSILLDITEQKEAERAAYIADQRLREAIEAMPAGFRIFDANERLVLWNSKYKEQTRWHGGNIEAGITFEEILGKTAATRNWIDQVEHDETYIEKRLAEFRNPGPPYETSRSDGRSFLHVYRKMSDGGTVSVMYEITDQKRAEKAAEAAHQRLLDAIEIMPAGFRIFDAEERLVLWNSKYEELTRWHQGQIPAGITFEEILQKSILDQSFAGKDDPNDAYIASRLADFRNPRQEPFEVRRTDGKTYLSFYRKTRAGETVSVLYDVTEQKRAMQQAQLERQRLLDSINSLPVGFRLYDRNERLIYSNDQNTNQFAWKSEFLLKGDTYEKILRKSVGEGLHVHDMESDEAYIQYRLNEFRNSDGKPVLRTRSDGRTGLMYFRKTSDGETACIVIDITDRVAAERLAQENHRLLQDAIESLPAGFLLFDADERLVLFNSLQKEATSWHGDLLREGVSYEELVRSGVGKGMHIHDFPSDEGYMAYLLKQFRTETPAPLEVHYVDGRHALVIFRKTSNGGTVSIQMDVTARVEAENRAKQASQRLFDAIESLPIGFALFNQDGQLVINNSRQRDATPWHGGSMHFCATFEDLVQSSIKKRIYAGLNYDDPVAVNEFVARRLEHFRHAQGEAVELARSDGSTTLTVFHKTTDGGTVSVMIDITERKRAERALKASEARLNAILDLAPEAILTADANNRIQMFNAGAERLFGYPADDVYKRNLDTLFAERERDEFLKDDGNAREANHFFSPTGGRRELIALHRSGREFPVEISVAETTVDGVALRTVLLQDISERKQWEDDLRRAMQLADAANRAKSEFLSHMSHELRTPLNGILGYAEFIKEKWLGEEALDRYVEYAGFIAESGQHLLQLINDILDLSKVEAGHYEPEFERIDINRLFEDCHLIVATDAEKERISINYDIRPGGEQWTADQRALKQILINLLSNAIKFSETGSGVHVTSSRDEHGHYCLDVRDSGIGMTEAEAKRALEPFVQIGQPYTTRQKGTGLGLALVVRLAALHSGSVKIDSAPGQGTTVRIAIPPLPCNNSDAGKPPRQLSA